MGRVRQWLLRFLDLGTAPGDDPDLVLRKRTDVATILVICVGFLTFTLTGLLAVLGIPGFFWMRLSVSDLILDESGVPCSGAGCRGCRRSRGRWWRARSSVLSLPPGGAAGKGSVSDQ